jgi:hypothetical protein
MDLPARIAKLPTFRGHPVPVTAWVAADGTVDFRISDEIAWRRVVAERRCGVCGEPLEYWLHFVGGPPSVAHRAFFDPAMHEECARYSVAVCPFLNGDKDYAPMDRVRARHPAETLVEIPHRAAPDAIAMLTARRYHVLGDRPPLLVAQGVRDVEWLRGAPAPPAPEEG